MTVLNHLAQRITNTPLMIHPAKAAQIAAGIAERIGIDATDLLSPEAIAQGEELKLGAFEPIDRYNPSAGKKPYRTVGNVAIVEIVGTLVARGSFVRAASGILSYEALKFQIASAAADETVAAVVLDIDSPGGEAVGAFEVADVVRETAKSKEVVAVVNGMAASAAYAIASAATRIVTTTSGISGSIGVVMLHADYSNQLHQAGIVPTMIFAGARKVDGNPYEKLTDGVKSELQADVNKFLTLFVNAVAQGRKGLTKAAIRATEARTFIGADAVAIGLADAVGTLESVIGVLNKQAKTLPGKSRGRAPSSLLQVALAGEEAAAAAVDRVSAILTCDEARGLEALARSLARLPSDSVSIEAAIGILAKAKSEARFPFGSRSRDSEYGLIFERVGPATGVKPGSWDTALTKAGMKI